MKTFKKLLIIFMTLLFIAGCSNNNESEDILHIGVIQFAKHEALDAAYDGFIEALENAGYVLDKDYKIDYQNAQGDSAVAETIATKLVNAKSDLIYAIGTPAAQAVANKTSEIPIVIAAVTDPLSSGLVLSNETPGVNVSGVSDLTPVKRQIDLLKEIIPDVKTVGIMYANSEDNSRFQADIAKETLDNLNIEWVDASVSDSNQIQQLTESLIGKVDAIYVPTDNMISESFSLVASIANEHKIPTMVGEIAMVKTGGLITDGIDYKTTGVRAGEIAVDVLMNGKDISEIPIVYLEVEDLELAINTTTEDLLGLNIVESIKAEAIIIE